MTKTILIITAMPEEMACLQKAFTITAEKTVGAFRFFESALATHTVVTTICGIGKANAATCTAVAATLYQPDLVINVGVAGGLHPSLEVGDVVVASELNYHDADATAFGYVYGQIPRMPASYSTDKTWVDLLTEQDHAFTFQVVSGLLCSGDSFVADESRVIEIKKQFPDIIGLDMESCAIAQCCHQLDIAFCCLRSISDAANSTAKMSYDLCLELAVAQVTQVLQVILAKLVLEASA